MKTRLLKLTKEQLEQMFYTFFNSCLTCREFIEYVPKKKLVEMITKEMSDEEIQEYLTNSNL